MKKKQPITIRTTSCLIFAVKCYSPAAGQQFQSRIQKARLKKSYLFYCSGSKTAVTIYFIFINKRLKGHTCPSDTFLYVCTTDGFTATSSITPWWAVMAEKHLLQLIVYQFDTIGQVSRKVNLTLGSLSRGPLLKGAFAAKNRHFANSV